MQEHLLFNAIATSKASQHIRKAREHRTCEYPWRDFTATARDHWPFQKRRLRLPTDLRKHPPYSRPAEARLNEKASAHMAGLRRKKWNGTRATTWDERQPHSAIGRRHFCRNIEPAKCFLVESKKRLCEGAPAAAPLGRRENLR